MSFWNKKPSSAKLKAPAIRIEKVATASKPAPVAKASALSRNSTQTRPGPSASPYRKSTVSNGSRSQSSDSLKPKPRRQENRKRRSPALQRFESDSSDDDETDNSIGFPNKKRKLPTEGNDDLQRQLRSKKAFSEEDVKVLIHAADIASRKLGFGPAFGVENRGAVTGEKADSFALLQYPGGLACERYDLCFLKTGFDPVEEIIAVVKEFSNFFLPSEQAEPFQEPDSGLIRRLERARNVKSLAGFMSALEDYNAAVNAMVKDGSLAKNLENQHSLPQTLVVRIMTQIYDRSVSPDVEKLRKYDTGTKDSVYGELKSNFVYEILVETKIKSNQVFVDLGSGVANVVLQAALQIGCESWGCEIMNNACDLAEAQKSEFEARCKLWGIKPGPANLERGDFLLNDNIREALKRADVVLVNNEVFTPETNNHLINLFLDLKEGCKIVSLKSFVPPNHKITSRNQYNPVNLLDVQRKRFGDGHVSWKDDGGDYFIATKDSKRLKSYEDMNSPSPSV